MSESTSPAASRGSSPEPPSPGGSGGIITSPTTGRLRIAVDGTKSFVLPNSKNLYNTTYISDYDDTGSSSDGSTHSKDNFDPLNSKISMDSRHSSESKSREGTHSGFVLVKRKKIPKKWKRRFIVLDEAAGEFHIFRNDQEYTPKESIDLMLIQDVGYQEFDERKNRYKFTILKFEDANRRNSLKPRRKEKLGYTSYKRYRFSTDTCEMRDKWVSMLQSAIQRRKLEQQRKAFIREYKMLIPAFEKRLRKSVQDDSLKLLVDFDSLAADKRVFEFLSSGEIINFLEEAFTEMYSQSDDVPSDLFLHFNRIVIKQKEHHTVKNTRDENYNNNSNNNNDNNNNHNIDSIAGSELSQPTNTTLEAPYIEDKTAITTDGLLTIVFDIGEDGKPMYINKSEMRNMLDLAGWRQDCYDNIIQNNKEFLDQLLRLSSLLQRCDNNNDYTAAALPASLINLEWTRGVSRHLLEVEEYTYRYVSAEFAKKIVDSISQHLFEAQSQLEDEVDQNNREAFVSMFGSISIIIDVDKSKQDEPPLLRLLTKQNAASAKAPETICVCQSPEELGQWIKANIQDSYIDYLRRQVVYTLSVLHDRSLGLFKKNITFALDNWDRITTALSVASASNSNNKARIASFLRFINEQYAPRISQFLFTTCAQKEDLFAAVTRYISKVLICYGDPQSGTEPTSPESPTSAAPASPTSPSSPVSTPMSASSPSDGDSDDKNNNASNERQQPATPPSAIIKGRVLYDAILSDSEDTSKNPRFTFCTEDLSTWFAKWSQCPPASEQIPEEEESPTHHDTGNGSGASLHARRKSRSLTLETIEKTGPMSPGISSRGTPKSRKLSTRALFDKYPYDESNYPEIEKAIQKVFHPAVLTDKDCQAIVAHGLLQLRCLYSKYDEDNTGYVASSDLRPLIEEYTEEEEGNVNDAKIDALVKEVIEVNTQKNNNNNTDQVLFSAAAHVLLVRALPELVKKNTERRRNVLMFGLDSSGKTSILYALKKKKEKVVPSIGLSSETIAFKSLNFVINELGGTERHLWKYYVEKQKDVHALILVVDSSDETRLQECRKALKSVMKMNKHFSKKPVLIYANKHEREGALSEDQLTARLQLPKYLHEFKVQPCSAVNKEGTLEGLGWLFSRLAGDNA